MPKELTHLEAKRLSVKPVAIGRRPLFCYLVPIVGSWKRLEHPPWDNHQLWLSSQSLSRRWEILQLNPDTVTHRGYVVDVSRPDLQLSIPEMKERLFGPQIHPWINIAPTVVSAGHWRPVDVSQIAPNKDSSDGTAWLSVGRHWKANGSRVVAAFKLSRYDLTELYFLAVWQ